MDFELDTNPGTGKKVCGGGGWWWWLKVILVFSYGPNLESWNLGFGLGPSRTIRWVQKYIMT